MTNLVPVATFDDVPQIEVSTALLGGPGGPMNAQAQALANRTQKLKNDFSSVTSHLGRVSAASLPRFFKKLQAYRHDLQLPLKVLSFGSSVWVGGGIPDPATQAPGQFFTSTLKARLDPANLYNIVSINKSVNGSVSTQFITSWNEAIANGDTPDLVLLGYGMNCGAVAQYNNGQTFPGFYTSMRAAILKARSVGADVIICTTPHPACVTNPGIWAMPSGIGQAYPTIIPATPTPEQIQPPASQSNITADFIGNGVPITVAHRYFRINQAMRALADEFGCALIDAERFWFEALQKYQIISGSAAGAEAYLFNAGETVHPNLLGHQVSYQAAMLEFVSSVSSQTMQYTPEPMLNGRKAVNIPDGSVEGAAFDIYAQYGETTTKPMSVKAQIGTADGNGIGAQTEVLYVDPANGDLCTPTTRLGGKLGRKPVAYSNYAGTAGSIDVLAGYNKPAGGTFIYTLPDNSGGTICIRAEQPGVVASQLYENVFTTHNGAVLLGTPRDISAGSEFTISVSGLNVVATSVYSGTSFFCKVDTW